MPRLEIERIEARDLAESSTESFDRIAFAEKALALVQLENTRVAICPGARRMHVDSGRRWGHGDQRWVVVFVPERASRRAIANAILELTPPGTPRPWALDVLTASAYR